MIGENTHTWTRPPNVGHERGGVWGVVIGGIRTHTTARRGRASEREEREREEREREESEREESERERDGAGEGRRGVRFLCVLWCRVVTRCL